MLQYLKNIFVLLLLVSTVPVMAQQGHNPPSSTEQFLWFRYTLELPLSEKWRVEQEIEERLHAKPFRQGEFRLRSHLQRSLGQGWTLDVGGMVVWESEPIEPRRNELEPRLELRPHQQISYEHTLGEKWSFEHTYKIEERFFRNKNEEGQYRDAGMSFGQVRFRYELEVGYQLNDWLGLVAFDELVFYAGPAIGPNPFDRNELGGGFDFTLSDAFGLQAIYNYRYNPEGVGSEIVHQHIARFTLTHTLGGGAQK